MSFEKVKGPELKSNWLIWYSWSLKLENDDRTACDDMRQ